MNIITRKRFTMISTLLIVSICLIGMCSFSYAVWANTLVIETEIRTGCLDINFDHNDYYGKNLENIELIPNEPVRIKLSDNSTIPSKFKGYQSELKDKEIRLEYFEEDGYIEITLIGEPDLEDLNYNIEILFEQGTRR